MSSHDDRLAPLDPEQWGPRTRELPGGTIAPVSELEGRESSGSGTLNILRTIAHHPTLLEPFLGFASTLSLRGVLPRRDHELLALRAAREELRRGEEFIRLTAAETSLLTALARQAGVPVSREALISESPIIGNARSIDVQVTRLRRKIEVDPKFPRHLQTVRGTGYVLMPDAFDAARG